MNTSTLPRPPLPAPQTHNPVVTVRPQQYQPTWAMLCRTLLPRPPPCMAHFRPAPTPLQTCQNMSDIRCTLDDGAVDDDIDANDAASTASSDLEPRFCLSLQLHGRSVSLPFFDDAATIQDLSEAVADELAIPPANQKFLITPKVGLLKPPFRDATIPLRSLLDKKIVLMGATAAEVHELETVTAARIARTERRRTAMATARQHNKVSSRRDWKKSADEAKYTFHSIRPLAHLPAPERSRRFLERLADDAGIKASMRRHRFSVGLLTEMDPAAHTTHESRTLGLNRNRGQVIELRLRTDAYDGYRDYKVIRKTLCHELAHNVWGEHDRNFWNLCHEIEAEVERNDWRRGGHTVGAEEFYNSSDDAINVNDEDARAADTADAGGWIGGEFVLGTGPSSDGRVPAHPPTEPLTRREIMARAADERMRLLTDDKPAPTAAEQRSKSRSGSRRRSQSRSKSPK